MKRLFRYDFLIVLVCIFLLGVNAVMYFVQPNAKMDSDVMVLSKRLQASELSWKYNGRRTPLLSGVDAVSLEQRRVVMNERRIVLLLGNTGCNPCQVREMMNLDKLIENSYSDIEVLALYVGGERIDDVTMRREALLLRRASKITFPIWYTSDNQLRSFMADGRYPMLFMLENDVIVSSFAAEEVDEEFSNIYFSILLRILDEEKSGDAQ